MKRGFTLIELMAVVALMGVMLLIIVPQMTKQLKQNTEDSYENFKNEIYLSTESYIANNLDKYSNLEIEPAFINMRTLIKSGYLKSNTINPKTSTKIDENATVVVTQNENKTFTYQFYNYTVLSLDDIVPVYDVYTKGMFIYYNENSSKRCLKGNYNCNKYTVVTENDTEESSEIILQNGSNSSITVPKDNLIRSNGITDNYVQDKLITFFDVYKKPTTVNDNLIWKDLSGNEFNGQVIGTVLANGVKLNGSGTGIFLGNNLIDLFKENMTLDITLSFDMTDTRDILLGNYESSNSINIERGSSASNSYTNRIRFFYNMGNTLDRVTTENVVEDTNIVNLTIVFKKDSNEIITYRNGEVVENATQLDLSGNYNFISAWIGRDSRTASTSLEGTIYSVRIYKKDLSASEIEKNYNLDETRFNIE